MNILRLQISALMFLVALSSCNNSVTPDTPWKPLKPLKAYQSKDFKFDDAIDYLEIRQYEKTTEGSRTPNGRRVVNDYDPKKYTRLFSYVRKPLNAFEKQTVAAFKSKAPVINDATDIKKKGLFGMTFSRSNRSNAFYINNKNQVGRFNKKRELISALGNIDTPAELQLVVWLEKDSEGKKYRKVSDGYEVISEYSNQLHNLGECGHFTHQVHIGKNGKILSYKLLEKKDNEVGCVMFD